MKRHSIILTALVCSLVLNILLIATMGYVRNKIDSIPLALAPDGHLVIKPGFTIPGRSIDAAGNGWSYHITRFDSYKAPDWKPK